jgi:tetratricopeptide (TPR) repeat protein
MASTYYELNDYPKAIIYYLQLVMQNKINDYRVYFNLAMCYERLGDNLKATENYQQSLKLNPDFSSAVINYSNLLITLGKNSQAKYALEQYLKNNRNDMRALNNLNIILAEKNVDAKVEENFKKITQNGAITSVYNNGIFLTRQAKFSEALSVFKSLVERL